MIKLTERVRKAMKKTAVSFWRNLQKNQHQRFDDKSYYIHLDMKLLSLRPYGRWKEARAAAKRQHPKAFIVRGATLNKAMYDGVYEEYKRAWGTV